MIQEALEYVSGQAVNAKGPHYWRPTEEPPHVYYVDRERVVAEPRPRNHQALDLTAIIDFAKDLPAARVWYSRSGVVCLLDHGIRRDVVHLKLDYSPQMKQIQSWGAQSKPYSQRELILLLRTMFKENMRQCPTLIDILRTLKFKTGSDSEVTVGKNKASIGRSVESQVTGLQEIPDDVFFNVPIFAEPFSVIDGLVNIAIEADAGTEKIMLLPIPGSVEKQITVAEAAIRARLVEELGEGKVLYGVP